MRREINFRWLFETTGKEIGSAGLDCAARRLDYSIPAEIGVGWYEQEAVSHFLKIFKRTCYFKPEVDGQLFPIGEVVRELPEPSIFVNIMHRGLSCNRESAPKAELFYRPGTDLFRHTDHLEFTSFVDTSTDNVMSGFSILASALPRLIGEDIADAVLQNLALTRRPAAKVMELPMYVSAPLRAIMTSTYTGNLHKLFAHAKTLEYLCILAHHVTQGTDSRPNSRKKDLLIQLHEELTQLDGKIPKLEELSVQYGMSVRALNTEFKKLFGNSLHSFVIDQRLQQAHAALTESDIAIKTLAGRLGYSHSNHFITAFRRKFGYPPGRLRKKAGD